MREQRRERRMSDRAVAIPIAAPAPSRISPHESPSLVMYHSLTKAFLPVGCIGESYASGRLRHWPDCSNASAVVELVRSLTTLLRS